MRPGSCLSLLGFHRSKCWMWTTTTVQQCLWALDWQNEREREGGGAGGEREIHASDCMKLDGPPSTASTVTFSNNFSTRIWKIWGFFAHNASPSVVPLHVSSLHWSCWLTPRSRSLLVSSTANQQTRYQWESDWLYHMVHSLLITSSDNSSSSLLMTRGTAVIVMFVGEERL